MSSGRVFQWIIAFTEKDDNPKAEWRKGTTQSLVDDDLVDLTETVVFYVKYLNLTNYFNTILSISKNPSLHYKGG